MGFLAPLWLVLLLLGTVIVWLHRRRRTHRSLEVSSIFLWRKLAATTPPAAPQKRPPLDPLLLLQLLLLLLLTLALAQPVLGLLQPTQHLIYVLDASGSMLATDVAPNRFEAAKKELERFLQTHPEGNTRVSLVLASPSPRVLAARQNRASALIPTLKQTGGSQGTVRWNRVAALVQSLRLQNEQSKIVLLGDGSPEAEQTLKGLGIPLELRIIAAKGTNVGFSSLQITPPAKGFHRTKVNGAIRQFGSLEPSVTVEVYFRSSQDPSPTLLTSQKVSLARNRAALFELFFSLPGSGVIELRLPPDALEADNRAFFVLRDQPRSLRVLHLGQANPVLERALKAIAGLEVSNAAALPADSQLYDLVVVDKIKLGEAPKTNTLWIEPPNQTRLPDPYPTRWLEDHPLSQGVNWASLEVQTAQKIPRQTGAEVLLEATESPLVQAQTTPFGRQVWLAFDPSQSNWPRQPSFPVFISNLVHWIEPSVGSALVPSCQVGILCPLDPRWLAADWQLLDPHRKPMPLTVGFVQEGPTRYLPRSLEGFFRPQLSGVYTLISGSLKQSIAVNALGAESDIRAKTAASAGITAAPKPLWVWLLGLAVLTLILEGWLAARLGGLTLKRLQHNNPLSQRQRRGLLFQGLALLGLLLALLPLQLPLPSRSFTQVLLVDRPGLHTGRSRAAVESALQQHRGPVVWLGSKPSLTMGADQTSDYGSDLEAALSLGAGLIPAQSQGKLTLISDGLQTRGNAAEALSSLLLRGIALDVLPVGGIPSTEVFVDYFGAPRYVHAGDRVVLQASVYSAQNTEALALISRQNKPWIQKPLHLLSGHNRLEIPLLEFSPGPHRYDLEIQAPNDPFKPNNRQSILLQIHPSPKIALFALEPGPAQLFQKALRLQGLDAEVKNPADAPKNLEGWASYEAAVLMNIPATRLSTEQQKTLEAWVKDQGGGLLMLGGANSYGPGGYYQTALDRLSPLSSKIPQEAPKVAMLFLLDKSGSMNQPTGAANARRVDIARQAILEAMRLLHPESLAGVVAFDTNAEAIVPVQSVKNTAVFDDRLSSIQTGGGTALYPALVAAYGAMHGVSSLARHVVLLSDGLSEVGNFEGIVGQMAAENITLSTVAIGEGADVELVEKLARLGKGAAHVSSDWQALPGILAQEALLLSATPVKQKAFEPRWTAADKGLLEGWPTALPTLGGYVLTTAKPAAQLHLIGPNQAPVLASWRVGMGQVVAFTSQGVGAWANGWTALPQFAPMWAQVIHQILLPSARVGLSVQTHFVGDELRLEAQAIQPDTTPQSGLLLQAKLGKQSFTLEEPQPGRYSASVIPDGSQVQTLEVQANTDPPLNTSIQTMPPIPNRYAFTEGNSLLLGLSQASKGRVWLSPQGLFEAKPPLHWETHPAWPLLLLLALGLFLAGLWVRYAPVIPLRKPTEPSAANRAPRANRG